MHEQAVTKIQFVAPHQVRVITESVRFKLAPHDVLLKTRTSIVSPGTELAKLTGLQPVAFPFDPGNRAVGEILALGAAVQDAAIGDRVFSYTPHWSHAAARRLYVRVPDAVDELHAPFAGLASVGMTSLRVGAVELGDRVVVLGMGLVGNLAAQLCQRAGARVVVGDLNPARLQLAQACALRQTVDVGQDDARTRILDATDGHEPDVVVEASGTPEGAALAMTLTGFQGEGNVVLLGTPRRSLTTDITPLLNRVHLWRGGSVNLKGAHEWRYPLRSGPFAKHSIERNLAIVFELMARRELILEPLVSRIASPGQAPEAFAAMQERPERMIGVLFDWRATGPA